MVQVDLQLSTVQVGAGGTDPSLGKKAASGTGRFVRCLIYLCVALTAGTGAALLGQELELDHEWKGLLLTIPYDLHGPLGLNTSTGQLNVFGNQTKPDPAAGLPVLQRQHTPVEKSPPLTLSPPPPTATATPPPPPTTTTTTTTTTPPTPVSEPPHPPPPPIPPPPLPPVSEAVPTTCSGVAGNGKFKGKTCQHAWDTLITKDGTGVDGANRWCDTVSGCRRILPPFKFPAQSIQCQPAYGNYSVVQPICTVTPTPSPPAQLGIGASAPAVAIIMAGQLKKMMEPAVLNSAQLLTRPFIRDFGLQNVHLYLCVDKKKQLDTDTDFTYGEVKPFAVFEHAAANMWQRLRLCHDAVKKYCDDRPSDGEHGNLWPRYRWIVRTRPDLVFYAEPPSPLGWPSDSIYLRARRVGQLAVQEERLAWWMYQKPQWGVCDLPCVWRASTGQKLPPAAAMAGAKLQGCAVVDDQFAIFAPKWFASYFVGPGGRQGLAAPPAMQPCVKGHEKCGWPEGKMTCRLLDAGARLQLVPLSYRINHWRFVSQKMGPPFTRPSALPSAGPIGCKNGGRAVGSG
eukprot:SAG22_NODE_952_length_6343_cov_3.567265_2_plen_568_part_00